MDDLISRADAIAVVRHCQDPIKNLEALPGVKVEKFTDKRCYNDVISRHSNFYDFKEYIKGEMVRRIARYLQECNAIAFGDEENCGLDEKCITATLLVIMPEPPKEESV